MCANSLSIQTNDSGQHTPGFIHYSESECAENQGLTGTGGYAIRKMGGVRSKFCCFRFSKRVSVPCPEVSPFSSCIGKRVFLCCFPGKEKGNFFLFLSVSIPCISFPSSCAGGMLTPPCTKERWRLRFFRFCVPVGFLLVRWFFVIVNMLLSPFIVPQVISAVSASLPLPPG